MAEYMVKYSAAPLRQIKAIQFGVISAEQIRSMSPLTGRDQKSGKELPPGITEAITYNEMGVAVEGGLSDPRLGSLDDPEDPGQFGFIDLAAPVYHVGFMNIVITLLRCLGYHTHKLLIDENSPGIKEIKRLHGRKRLHAIMKLCEGITTDRNGGLQPKFRREGLKLFVDFTNHPNRVKRRKDHGENGGDIQEEDLEEEVQRDQDQGKRPLKAAEALAILRDLNDDDCRLLGFDPKFCHPSWLIVTSLPVPPLHVRPSIAMSASQRCEDDITHKLADIVKANIALKRNVQTGAPQHVKDEITDLLQWHAATLIDNGLPYAARATQKSGKPLKTLRQRLVGKEGRVRGNLMGKRCDFTARSVITADPNLSIDQVGVPRSIAAHMTVPERVTSFNKERLRQLVRKGPNEYPGARYVLKDGLRTDLRYSSKEIVLREGDVVERHLANDDVVLFNRQPSLHKMSIMGHRVRVFPWSTFRLNLSVTTPYNADFDGDEMNMHVPQSLLARTEAETLMMVNKVIVSPQSNRPVMGIVQDALLSSSLMTRRDVFVTKEVLMNILTWIEGFNGDIPIPAVMLPIPNRPGEREQRWTGKQLFNLVIPKNVNMNHTRSNGHNGKETFEDLMPNDTWVNIEEGEILSGMMDKKSLGNSGGGLIHIVCNECGPEAARVLFNQIQKVTNYWVLQRSYTVGVGDTVADEKVMEAVDAILTEARSGVADLVRKGQKGLLEKQPGRTMAETFEDAVNIKLNSARDDAGKKAEQSIQASNGFKGTVQAGSKGSFLNIAQIMACVGQQNVDGKRIPYGFDRRTLPHFAKDDLGPESRGFVENCYLKGLSPQEFFFHAMGGRVGLIDTACKTAETGYIQRRLVKALEDVSVRYDGTVRNGRGEIVQFLYGEDGMDAGFIEAQNLDILTYNENQMKDKYQFQVDDSDFGIYRENNYLEYQVIDSIRKSPESRKILEEEFMQFQKDKEDLLKITYAREPAAARYADKAVYLPVNIARMILNAKKIWKMDETKPSDLDPVEVILAVRELKKRLVVVPGDDTLSVEAQQNATLLFGIYLRSTLSAKQLLRDHRMSRDAFKWLLREIETRFFNSIVAPGEMCGVLAAQSIGEPATQMTLNTFHHAGVSAKNVTLGVPRLKEIINVSRNAKTPSLTVFLSEDVRNDRNMAETVLNRIEFATLRSFTQLVEIVYDPFPVDQAEIDRGKFTIVKDDFEWVKAQYELSDEEHFNPDNLGSFVLRMVLDRTLLRFKKITLKEIIEKVQVQFKTDEFELIAPEGDNNPTLRIRMKRDWKERRKKGKDSEAADDDNDEESQLMIIQRILLDDMVLRGVKGIPKVFIREQQQQKWTPKGFVPSKEWVLDTEGTNLKDVLGVEGVDHKRTISNDITQVIEVLGIEAVRKSIFNELRLVISFDGSYVNYRHLALLVDIMTSRGFIMAITRHGVNRAESGALMRASFEETVEILMEAAAFSEIDPLSGVSENIMVGKLAPVGSGICSLVLDEALLAKYAIENVKSEDDDDYYDGGGGFGMPLGTPDARTPLPYTPGNSSMSPSFGGFSPSDTTSPGASYYNPKSPNYSAVSPAYGGSSPYSPTSPAYSPSSPAYSPSSPAYSPSSPAYSPSSPAYSPSSPAYSPSSPAYSPSSPSYKSPGVTSPQYSPSSPNYSPSSPAYSPSSPAYSPSSPAYSPSSPAYSPSSPSYSPSSPNYGGPTNAYSPSSPNYSPSSPAYSPSSPSYSPSSPAYSPSSPAYSPTSPSYSPNASNNNQTKDPRQPR